jgi:hypothetical protein
VVRLSPGFKALSVLEGLHGRALTEREALTFMSNGEREEAIEARAAALLKEGWEEVKVSRRVAAPRKAAPKPRRPTVVKKPAADLEQLASRAAASLARSKTKATDARVLAAAKARYRQLGGPPRGMVRFLAQRVVAAAAPGAERRAALLELLGRA